MVGCNEHCRGCSLGSTHSSAHSSRFPIQKFVNLEKSCYSAGNLTLLAHVLMNNLFGIIPTPQPMQPKSNVYDLKARLDWGEPALTILDVRDRLDFNVGHIQGAVSLPLPALVARALSSLELERDLYVYGESDDVSAEAAQHLRTAGYKNVSELRGGFPAWKAVGFPTEAIATTAS